MDFVEQANQEQKKVSRAYRYYLKRVLAGKCGWGGCDFPRSTSQYCEKHRLADLVRRKSRRGSKSLIGKSGV